MIAVLSKSRNMQLVIQELFPERTIVNSSSELNDNWLASILRNGQVSLVVYEPSFFIDPSQWRSISPATGFVVLASPGEENGAFQALRHGAAAVIHKPFIPAEAQKILALVLSHG